MDGLRRSVWQTKDATPTVDSQYQEGNYREEMGGGASLVQWESQQEEEVWHAEQSAESNGGPSAKAPGSALPSNQSGWHCRTGQYLLWTKNAEEAECGWCQYKTQTREHLLKHGKQWEPQQKTLWAGVRKETGRGKIRFTVRDLLADERCTRAVLDFLRTTKVGSRVGPRAVPPKPGEDEEAAKRGAGEAE